MIGIFATLRWARMPASGGSEIARALGFLRKEQVEQWEAVQVLLLTEMGAGERG